MKTAVSAAKSALRSGPKGRKPPPQKKVVYVPPQPGPEHGREIFIYNHLQTNQVVYSLTKALRNNLSLRQLPYNGKKTIPSALRKDLWAPLASVRFPDEATKAGLQTFQKLREFRKLHETEWPESVRMTEYEFDDKEKPGEKKTRTRFLSKKERGRKLCDQKANSVADLAAALGIVKREAEIGEVVVSWTDIMDAEFAESWPENVSHWHMRRIAVEKPSPQEESTTPPTATPTAAPTEANAEGTVVL